MEREWIGKGVKRWKPIAGDAGAADAVGAGTTAGTAGVVNAVAAAATAVIRGQAPCGPY